MVDGDLHVRAYNGTASRWYQAAKANPEGRVHAAGRVFDVTFEDAPPDLADAIDAAYRAKYRSSPYLAPMISARTPGAAFRLVPHP